MLIHETGSTDIVKLKKYGSSDSLRDNLKDDEPAIRDMVNRPPAKKHALVGARIR